MKYYIMSIEQYTPQGQSQDVKAEQSKVQRESTYDSALSYFYNTLKTVADSAAHNYLDIKITKSDGGIVKKDKYGEYIDPDATPTPATSEPANAG